MGKKNREDSAGFKIGVQIAKQAIDLGDMRKERDAALAERDAARGERDALREAARKMLDNFNTPEADMYAQDLYALLPVPVPEKGGEE